MRKLVVLLFAVVAFGTCFAVNPPALYMIGTATDGVWNLDKATEMDVAEGTDGAYSWSGYLSKGTFKICSEKNYDAPFYRPSSAECYISESGITAADVVYTTSPDDQWNVVTAGNYKIDINIKNLTITAEYLGDPGKRPIVTDALYILGDASPNSWDIGNPVAFEKKSEYVFVYEGVLKTGGLQMCLIPADWGAAFIVPVSNGCKIGKTGVAGNEFDYSPDHTNMWDVETEGRYRLTLDLKEWTVGAEYLGDQSGIGDVTVDDDSCAEYYDMRGVRVENPSGGIYLKRTGDRVSKVIVK